MTADLLAVGDLCFVTTNKNSYEFALNFGEFIALFMQIFTICFGSNLVLTPDFFSRYYIGIYEPKQSKFVGRLVYMAVKY